VSSYVCETDEVVTAAVRGPSQSRWHVTWVE